tara:strand:- start:57 stop:557 length:501 start_codon:yes stop_codon:yes gene_type:complete
LINYRVFLLYIPTAIIVLLLYLIFGYNYFEGFFTASEYENRHYSSGFLLLDYPLSYFSTRLENIAEILFFLGPVGCYLVYKERLNHNDSDLLLKYGILFFILVILTGAFRTGETARALMYIYPLIMISVSNSLSTLDSFDFEDSKFFLTVTWLQTLLMQLFGWYYW